MAKNITHFKRLMIVGFGVGFLSSFFIAGFTKDFRIIFIGAWVAGAFAQFLYAKWTKII